MSHNSDQNLILDMEEKQIVITGMGTISSIGNNKDDFFQSLVSGRCGIQELTKEDYPRHIPQKSEPSYAGRIKEFDPSTYFSEDEIEQFDYPTLIILKAVGEAIKESKLSISGQDISVIIGSAVGLRPTYDRLNASLRAYSSGERKFLPQPQYYPTVVMEFMMNTVLNAIFKKFNLQGDGLCLSTICASCATTIGLGTELIRNGRSNIVICVGFDNFHPRQNTVFSHFKMLSDEKSAPFDKSSRGFQLAEGVGVLVLEDLSTARKRDTYIYGKICGSTITNDAYHIVIPSPSAKEFAKAIELSIEEANIKPEDIDYISLIGRGSKMSDMKELEGIKMIFGDLAGEIPINSITSYTGYSLGASSILNFITTLLEMKEKVILPIRNFKNPHSKYKMNFVKEKPLKKEINLALVCSQSFAGVNTAIILKRYEE